MSEPYGIPRARCTPAASAPAAQYGWYVRGRRFSRRANRSGYIEYQPSTSSARRCCSAKSDS
eukprot:7379719-Prymnesium_polylepis.1